MKAVVVMSRIPVAGKTKTRLISDAISGEQAAYLHSCFIRDINNTLDTLPDDFAIFFSYSDEGDSTILTTLLSKRAQSFAQQGQCLDEKMRYSFDYLFEKGYRQVIMIASDLPQISTDTIIEASTHLVESDLVIAPTHDGGYYLIAMKKLYANLFTNEIDWGSSEVLQQTVDAVGSQVSLQLLASDYDIDQPGDLHLVLEYCRQRAICPNSVEAIEQTIGVDYD